MDWREREKGGERGKEGERSDSGCLACPFVQGHQAGDNTAGPSAVNTTATTD